MNNSLICLLGLLTIVMATSLLIVAAIEGNDAKLNNTSLSNITLDNMSLNPSTSNDAVLNATNETYFMLGNDKDINKSVFKIGEAIKPIKDASKLGYIIQSTPHGHV
jgi:hypothetical protein